MLPEAGDVFWAEFDPIRGSEQSGRRPALVVSTRGYHEASRRALVCPITSNLRPWPFNVPLPEEARVRGAVMVDQIRTVDRTERLFTHIETVSPQLLAEVRARLLVLAGLAA